MPSKTVKTVDWDKTETKIERTGSKIILPNVPGPMPIDDAIKALKRLKKEEETLMDVHEVIDAFPLEGAVAFVRAMKETYGWASPTPRMSFFGPIPPKMLSVEINLGEFIQVPWGDFSVPGIENPITTSATWKDGRQVMVVSGQVRKREQTILLELAQLARDILERESIYRNKAFHLRTDSDGDLSMSTPPQFIDLRDVEKEELIFNRDVEAQIDTNIFAPIRSTQACRDAGIPLKRGNLLEGKYGVGKTMTARKTADVAVKNGWTFVMIERSSQLKSALEFAQRYQPAVVFCEDIDRATGERDEAANDLLNTIDGILSKKAEVMVVLTTNHVESINKAMLRPGRLDSVISVAPPDSESVQRLVRLYSRGLLAEGETLDLVGEELAGEIPAVIREVVERSKLGMIAQGTEHLTEEALIVSANGMKAHLALLKEQEPELSDEEVLGRALKRSVAGGFKEAFRDTEKKVDEIHQETV